MILELARSLHACGSPAYELDQNMEQVATSLGKSATFFSTPTALFVTFDGEIKSTRLIRVYPCDTNLGRYAELFDLQRSIRDDALATEDAWQRLQEINLSPNGYHAVAAIASYGIAASCVGVLVGGNLSVAISSGLIGLLVGMLVTGLTHLEYQTHLINVIAGFLASAVACSVQAWIGPSHFELTTLSALIVLVPGLHLTISINELVTQNLASGSARLAGAMTTLLTLIFGVFMGYGFVSALTVIPPSVAPIRPTLFLSLLVAIPIGLGLAVLFRTRYRDIPWLVISTVIGYGTMRVAGEFFSPFAAVWIASVVAGVFSNHVSFRLQLPSAVMLMPALILLVPGSLGFSGMTKIMLNQDLPSGIRLITTMVLTAVSIVAGLLITDVLAPRTQHPTIDR
ncbi:threonine/serine exporter family protein [Neorhodopirellula lusitana]|uniref:threonine/serine ThrE exporter family protein n=1 Tax=Neorhodopirellula lusitana TaxID=445327 RepID=UPI00384DC6E6